MKRRTNRLATAVGIALMATAVLATSAAAIPGVTTETTVFTVPTGTEPPAPAGEATLVRGEHDIQARVAAEDLEPGVYTLWWILFNQPEACLFPGECGPWDLTNPAVVSDLGYAGGVVVGENGTAHITARLAEGEDIVGFPDALPGIQSNTGLEDAMGTEVHLVVHAHGPVVPGLVGEQLNSFAGGCDHPFGDEYGTPGPNPTTECMDVRFAVFRGLS